MTSPGSMRRDALLDGLNDRQLEAVSHGDGPLLIVAGAGSGKTRVITRRIAHLVARGVRAHEILAITFTNKAAGEMRERVEGLVGEGRVLVSTFHAFCARVLRTDGEHVGLPRGFTIYDREDQVALVKDLSKQLGIDPQAIAPRALLSAISRFKNDGLSPDEVASTTGFTPFERTSVEVYARYAAALAEARSADFDDLLLLVTRLFREQEAVLDKYRTRFKYVLVDEYQDTNLIQDRIARDIAAGHGNFCVTGDPDQSIYRWRGARIRNILDFQRDYPTAHVVRLEQNYRSTGHILAAASAVIANNPGRLMGPLWSDLGEGSRPVLLAAEDDESEADAVVRRIKERRDEGLPLAEMAVLYRTNALSRALERSLRVWNVPYEIVGSVEFYERKEVKDVLAYLRVLVNPADAVSFLRIVNTPTRGLGRASLERLRAWALPQGLSPREASRQASRVPGLGARARAAFAQLTALLDGLEATLGAPPTDTLRAVIDKTGYREWLGAYGGQDGEERLQNIAELEAAVATYGRSTSDPTVSGFLQDTALLSDVDGWDAGADRLTLMTLHSSKGLEFSAVYLVGMEEGLLPHARAFDDDEELREERRLLYVGMTRARRHLTLSWAARRATYGNWMPTRPSRFLDELPPDRIEHAGLSSRPAVRAPDRRFAAGESTVAPEFTPDADDYLDVEPEVRLPRPGATVRHAHFGRGVVLAVAGVAASARITVRFERFGDKQLLAQYARLDEVF